MVPTLIVLGLLALGVGIVAFATRQPPTRIEGPRVNNDTAWSEPAAAVPKTDPADPFAHAPPATSPMAGEPADVRPLPAERAQ